MRACERLPIDCVDILGRDGLIAAADVVALRVVAYAIRARISHNHSLPISHWLTLACELAGRQAAVFSKN